MKCAPFISFLYPLSNTANFCSCCVGQYIGCLWHCVKSRIYAGFQDVVSTCCPALCGTHGDLQCHAACWCCQWLPWFFSWPLQTAVQAFNSNSLHWLCYYMILCPEAGVPQCPCHAAWTDPLCSMPTSCCMVISILRTPQLTVPFNTSICWCVYCLEFRMPQQCLEWLFSVVHASYSTQYLVCKKNEILLKSLVWVPHG